jgi:hypothetical protein
MTFNGEVDGEIYRLGQGSVHQAEHLEVKSGGTGLKKSNSGLLLAMNSKKEEEEDKVDEAEDSPENT